MEKDTSHPDMLPKPEISPFLTTPTGHKLSSKLQDWVTPQNSKLLNPNMISLGQVSPPTTVLVVNMSPSSRSASPISSFPPLDVDRLGVPQPSLATKDILIIIFMCLLWGYSLYLTYRAWYKLLYSDTGEEGNNMWRLDTSARINSSKHDVGNWLYDF